MQIYTENQYYEHLVPTRTLTSYSVIGLICGQIWEKFITTFRCRSAKQDSLCLKYV